MKTYKVKFTDKKDKEIFSSIYDDIIGNNSSVGKVYDIKGKNKSVIIEAKHKDDVRNIICDVERRSYHIYDDIIGDYDGYCFGEENEDYFIKKVDADDYELE